MKKSVVSVTFTVENSGDDTNRTFPFPVARRAPEASVEVHRDDVSVENAERERGFEAAPWTRHASGASNGFLAGATLRPEYPTA